MDSVPLYSSSRLWDLTSRWNAKFTLIWKEDFGPLSNSPVLFLHSPGKMLLTLSLVQKWLGSPFPEDIWAWWLLMHWLQLQSTPCEALPSVWISFTWLYSQACGHPCCLCTFSYPNSSFQSTLHLICFDTALCKQPHLSVMTFCGLTLFVEGVNVHLLDHCQVSSLPHYCGFKEQEIPRIYTVGMVINWNSNVNILIFWDTVFWLSWAVSSNHQKTFEMFYFTCNESTIYESFTFWNMLQEKMNFFTTSTNLLRCTCIFSFILISFGPYLTFYLRCTS